jgi:lipid-binding SYLF domain-containing protein
MSAVKLVCPLCEKRIGKNKEIACAELGENVFICVGCYEDEILDYAEGHGYYAGISMKEEDSQMDTQEDESDSEYTESDEEASLDN